MAVIFLSVLYRKISSISYEMRPETPLQMSTARSLARSENLEISGPTDVKVSASTTPNLAKMLPPHILVPMSATGVHEELYESFVASRKMHETSELAAETSLQEGMSEMKGDVPFIDDTEL